MTLAAAIAWAIEPAVPAICCLIYFGFFGVAITVIVAIFVFVDAVTEMGQKPSDTGENAERKPRRRWAAEIDATMALVALGLLAWRLLLLIEGYRRQ